MSDRAGSAGGADQDKRTVRWIGGSPGAGKSSVTRLLARRHAACAYYCDWHQIGHARRETRGSQGGPALEAFRRKSLDERWVGTPPQEMAREVVAAWIERFPLVLADVDALPPGLCLVEGPGLFPEQVLPEADDPRHAVWLVPTPDFVRWVREDRYARADSVVLQTSDPPRALQNLIERDILLARHVQSEAVRLGGRVITMDGSRSVEAIADEVGAHFGLRSLSAYVGTYETSDGRRMTVEREEDSLILVLPNGRRQILQPHDDALFQVTDPPYIGEIVAFEVDAGGRISGLLAASLEYSRLS